MNVFVEEQSLNIQNQRYCVGRALGGCHPRCKICTPKNLGHQRPSPWRTQAFSLDAGLCQPWRASHGFNWSLGDTMKPRLWWILLQCPSGIQSCHCLNYFIRAVAVCPLPPPDSWARVACGSTYRQASALPRLRWFCPSCSNVSRLPPHFPGSGSGWDHLPISKHSPTAWTILFKPQQHVRVPPPASPCS